MVVREPGSILDGKYEIVQRLGSGGMGEVYLVRHVHLHELRVIKILRQDLATDPAAQKRFMREARLATQIKHPNVAILYDFATLPDGSFYMVWEHIQGQDAGDRIRRSGPLPVPVALQLGIQALHGLEAVHAAGIIHRDLSPDNLMITEDKGGQLRLKIIDLGLARTLEADAAGFEITQVGMFMGKLQYCSPEQAGVTGGGAALDHRSDLYSFALVLYEMIAGVPPFDSESQPGFIFKRLSEDPLPLRGRNPRVEVPLELDRVLRRALERERENRFPDARSFRAALESVEQGLVGHKTQEIPVTNVPPAPPAAASAPASPPPAAAPPRQRTATELSKAEKMELLAQIERASRRTAGSSGGFAKAAAAPSPGPTGKAEAPASAPVAASPAESREDTAVRRRAAETEQVLVNYLQKKQLPLARLALDTLLELAPGHPRRTDYQDRIAHLAEEVEKDKRAEAALAAGREALARRDLKAARRELESVVRNDPSGKRAEVLAREIETAERETRQGEELEARKRRFEELLAGMRVVEAEAELNAMVRLDVPRVTLDFYRERLAEARGRIRQEERVGVFEMRYRDALRDRSWLAAREVAHELGNADPKSRRAVEMLAEVDRLEAEDRRLQAVEQGVRQVETFVEQGDAAKAELALKILLQMDPDNRHRKRLEKQVREIAKR